MASIKEQRTKLKEKIAALQAREKTLAAKEKEKERKARTKRLIELGAIVESKLSTEAIEGLKAMTKEQLEKMDSQLAQHAQKTDTK